MKKSIWVSTKKIEVLSSKITPNKIKIKVKNIGCVGTAMAKKWIEILTCKNEKYYLKTTLKDFSKKIKSEHFIRVSKGFVFNKRYVKEVYIGKNNQCFVFFNKNKYRVGRAYLDDLKRMIKF